MSRSLFWLSDGAWAAIEPHLPKNQPGARCVDDRRVISGIVHMLNEMYVKLNGEMVYLWRPVDREGEMLESFVTKNGTNPRLWRS
jgi:hypothetical protein